MRKLVWTGVLAVAAVAFGGGAVLSQEKGDKAGEKGEPGEKAGHGDKAGGSHEMDPMMAEYMKFAAPGDHHKHLEEMAGEWDCAGKMWEDPTKPPQEMKGKASARTILGGRFLVEDFESQMFGMPFQGHGIAGYDNLGKRHTMVWMDSMGTYMMFTTGGCEGPGCKTITLEGTYPDPKGNLWGWKSVTTIEGKDKRTMVAYNIAPADMEIPAGMQREHKAMDLTYTRRK